MTGRFPKQSVACEEISFTKRNILSGFVYPSPIREGGKTVGTIIEVRDITREKQIERERETAAQEKEKLLIAEKEAREESETLRRIGQIISAELSLQKIVQAVTDAATELTGAQFGAFFITSAKKEQVYAIPLSGVAAEKFSNFPMPRATAMFGSDFSRRRTVRSTTFTPPRVTAKRAYHGCRKVICRSRAISRVVTSRSGEVLGFCFSDKKKPAFSARATSDSRRLAAQAAWRWTTRGFLKNAARASERTGMPKTTRAFGRSQRSEPPERRISGDRLARAAHALHR